MEIFQHYEAVSLNNSYSRRPMGDRRPREEHCRIEFGQEERPSVALPGGGLEILEWRRMAE